MYKLKTLPNGVRLVLVPMPSMASVSVATYVACGSRYEPKDITGVSHFLEHMVFKGTTSYPTPDDVHVIERMGGMQNAYTSIDVTKYYAKVLSEDWRKTLDVVTELALKPLLPDKDFDMERKVVIEEIAMHEDDLPDKSGELFQSLLYGENSMGRRIIGNADSLGRVNRSVMEEYHKDYYKAGNMVVVLSGKVDDESLVQSAVEESYGHLENATNKGFELVRLSQDRNKVRVLSRPRAEQANLVLGFSGCDRFNEDKFAFQVLNLLLGVGFTSRFFRKIREEKGLCYSISSSLSTYHDSGDWSVWAGLNTERIDEAISAIIDQIKLILDKGVEEQEVEVSKKRFATAAAFRMESPDGLGEFFGRQVVYGQPVLTVEEYLEKINQVTVSDIERVAKKYFVPNKVNLAVVGRYKKLDEERFMKLLTL